MRSASHKQGTWRRRIKRALQIAVILLGLSFTAVLVSTAIWPPINDVATGQTPEYPDIRPQILRYSPDLVFERAVGAIDDLPRWQVVDRDDANRRIRAEATTAVMGFTDDVTVDVVPYGVGSLVNVRSRSRIGRADFGQNARNIRTFQEALEQHLTLARQAD